MSKAHKGRGYVYTIEYHIVWTVKHRRNALNNKVKDKLIEILNKIAKDNKFTMTKIKIDLDYVHLLIECSPQNYIPDMIKALKGVSGRLLMKEYGEEFKEQLGEEHLWSKSYFVATPSEHTEEQIINYIESQK